MSESETVTRRKLAEALKAEYGGTISGHDDWIKKFIKILSREISDKGRVEIRGFGSFNLNTIKAHTTINPGAEVPKGEEPERIEVPETYTVDFRASGNYKERLRDDQKKKKAKKKSKKGKK